MEEIQIKENIFRIKQMNAIELLSLRPQLSFEDYDSTYTLYNLLLEKLEVEINGKWLPVKEKGRDIYYPKNIENDFETLEKLTTFMLDYLKQVFQVSNKSKKEQE